MRHTLCHMISVTAARHGHLLSGIGASLRGVSTCTDGLILSVDSMPCRTRANATAQHFGHAGGVQRKAKASEVEAKPLGICIPMGITGMSPTVSDISVFKFDMAGA